jgi:putative Holliday junction resolvase
MTRAEVVLAFDFGLKRIGIASGDTLTRTAAPLPAAAVGRGGPDWQHIAQQVRALAPAVLVVGAPYNVDGSEGALHAAARGFAAELERRYRVRVVLVDERYSSLEAASRLKMARETGVRKRRVAKADVDAAAACVILERWFSEAT